MFTLSLCLILGIAHGIADATAGFLLGSLSLTLSLEQASWLIILYNILGFGYQPVAGIVTDKLKHPRLSVIMGLSLLLLAIIIVSWQPKLAVFLAGFGSAMFHVGGGSLALAATPNRTIGPGIFAAPGVIGLAVGAALGLTSYAATGPLLLLLGGIMTVISLMNLPKFPNHHLKSKSQDSPFNDWVILVLIGAIALTSSVWTSFQFLFQTHLNLIIAVAVAAAIAKILGGILAQRWGWRRWVLGSLTVATLLLSLGGRHHLILLLSLALLQSNIPVTLATTAQLMPNQPATASGFALGLAILVGGIPILGGLSHIVGIPLISALLVMVTALSLNWVFQSTKSDSE